jgi:hypothetical protein
MNALPDTETIRGFAGDQGLWSAVPGHTFRFVN